MEDKLNPDYQTTDFDTAKRCDEFASPWRALWAMVLNAFGVKRISSPVV